MNKKEILVIDDDYGIREILEETLKMLNFEVTLMESATTTLEKIQNFDRFSFIISDYDMPLMTGAQLLQELKKKSVQVPCILFSSMIEFIYPQELEGFSAIFKKEQLDQMLEYLKQF